MKRALDIAIAVGLWFALGGFFGCGDAPAGADRCGGKCKGHEQCSLTKVELSGPACYPATSCTAYGFACVDPADVKIMSLEPEQ